MKSGGGYRYRAGHADLLPEFLAHGYAERHVFPHRVIFLRKAGPDALRLARSMTGPCNTGDLWLAVLHAEPEGTGGLPPGLFFDEDLVWHRQHFGLPGHVAFATFVVRNDMLYGLNYVADIVQRQDRSGPHRTRINKVFRGWPYLLLNALAGFAAERGLAGLRLPTSDLVMAHGDPARRTHPALFHRLYDAAVQRLFPVRRRGDWWHVDLAANRGRLVSLPARTQRLPAAGRRTICLIHDIEAGLGHRTADPALATRADTRWRANLESMSALEERHGVAATYSVVGDLFAEARPLIADGAALAFHSADHVMPGVGRSAPSIINRLRAVRSLRKLRANLAERRAGLYSSELDHCRRIDYRARGYRPPQSRIPRDLTPGRLAHYNFDWLASSRGSLGIDAPVLDGPVARIPILFDDYDLYRDAQPYDRWESRALEQVAETPFVAFGLHDCYGDLWLPRYDALLARLKDLGRLATLDQVTNEMFLARAV